MNLTSETGTRQDSCVRELEPPAKGTSRCTDLPNEAEAPTENKPITQRKCQKRRGPSGKPRSDWYKASLSFRIGSNVELGDAVALLVRWCGVGWGGVCCVVVVVVVRTVCTWRIYVDEP